MRLTLKLPLVVIVAILLTALASGLVSVIIGRHVLRQEALEGNVYRVKSYASAVLQYVDNARSILATTAELPQLRSLAQPREVAALVMAHSDVFEYVTLLTPEGTVAMLEPRALEARLSHRDLSFAAWFGEVRRTHGTVVSQLHISAATLRPTIMIAMPVHAADGRMLGIWAGALKLAEILELGSVAADPSTPGAGGYVTDRRGLIIAHQTEPNYVARQTDFSAVPPVSAALAGQTGSGENFNPIENELKLAAYRPLPDLGWAVVYSVPSAIALASLDTLTQAILLAAAALAALIGAGVFVSTRLTFAPLARLSVAAQTIGTGDFSQRMQTSSRDEIGQLAQAFNRMAGALGEKEAQARRRTAELQAANLELSGEIAERKHLENELQEAKMTLEQRVKERTADLQTTVARLTDSEARFRFVTESATDGIVIADKAGNIVGWNRSAERIFGYPAAEVLGKPLTHLMPHRYRDQHLAGMKRVLSSGEAHLIGKTVELTGLRDDGGEFPLELSLATWEADGRLFSGTIRDITRRKRLEERLQKLSGAVEQSPAATVITDTNGRIEYVNPRFSEITGYAPEELIGKTTAIIKSGFTPPEVYEDLWRSILSGREWRGDMQNRKKNGELYWEHEIISAVKNERGEIVNFIAVKEDITARRQAEQALQQKHASLLAAERELLNAQESLAEAARLEAVGRLAAGVAHEVKNPLTTIRLGVDYLAKQASQQNNQEVLQDVLGAVDRADYVVRDLLDFARLREFARRPTDINQVIDKAIHLLNHELKRRNVAIARNRGDRLPMIYADPDRLVQVFINILSNSAQAIGQDGSIEVVAHSMRLDERDLDRPERNVFRIGEQVIAVDVSDTGPGIPAMHEKKLFEPFFSTKPVGEGTGLGLAVSRNIVIMHKGSIDLSNLPKGGASARLMFRVTRERMTNE